MARRRSRRHRPRRPALVKSLADHPWFELTEVAASERSSGKRTPKRRAGISTRRFRTKRGLVVKGLETTLDCDFVFSALDSSVAGPPKKISRAQAIRSSAIRKITAWIPTFRC